MNLFSARRKRPLYGRMAKVAVAGVAAMAVAGTVGAGVASAAGAQSGPPYFNTPQASSLIRGSGSDTTVFMMQKIGDLYTTAGLYGCQLAGAVGNPLFGGGTLSSTSQEEDYCQPQSSDIATTDDSDNWDRVEVVQGVNDVGSGAGQNQLCGALSAPQAVDFARSSKPSANISGCNEQQLGYAKDGVPIVDFPSINPSTYGTSTFTDFASNAFPTGGYGKIANGNVGPVAAGWLPADNPAGTANNGTRLSNISNTGAIDTSVAYRIWCANASTPGSNAITDWGALTNLGPNLEVNVDTTAGSSVVTVDASSGGTVPSTIAANQVVSDPYYAPSNTPFAAGTKVSSKGSSTITMSAAASATGTYTLVFATGASPLAVGSGIPVGIPLRVLGVNTASGTNATFSGFALGQTPDNTSGCHSSSTLMNVNAANDPNAATAASGNPYHTALENNVHQLELFSTADFPNDPVDQAIEEATTLYYMSNGVYNTNSYAGETTIDGTSYSANLIAENGVYSGSVTELHNTYPTARTLFNIIDNVSVRQSTAGFMNWICDSDSMIPKGTDLSTGLNYDAELSNIITTNFGFPRLNDNSAPVSATPADNISAPNDSCVAQIAVTSDGTNVTVNTSVQQNLSGLFPSDLVDGGSVIGVSGGTVPSNETVTGGQGTADLGLSQALPAGNYTLEFPGVPPVLAASSNP